MSKIDLTVEASLDFFLLGQGKGKGRKRQINRDIECGLERFGCEPLKTGLTANPLPVELPFDFQNPGGQIGEVGIIQPKILYVECKVP